MFITIQLISVSERKKVELKTVLGKHISNFILRHILLAHICILVCDKNVSEKVICFNSFASLPGGHRNES